MKEKWRAYTSDGSSPRERAKVYYTGHPDDLDEYWEAIARDIWSVQKDCVIYRLELAEGEEDWEELQRKLKDMQLLVIPVTQKFLDEKNRAMERELPFALDQKIPVLPLLQEPGLEERFSEKCGGLQLLCKWDPDPTVRPYEEKLKERLSTTLLDDGERENVKRHFDARIFLSYRKKDRWEARRLMTLIHSREEFQGVSIWYDEYLTSGEPFEPEIKTAISESNLFVLAVTEKIVEPGNYVIREEYPAAREEGKPVLPVEMRRLKEPEKKDLAESFPNLPPCIQAQNGADLDNKLYRALKNGLKGELGETKTPGLRSYYIGLAYLNGICMEVDRKLAVAYITRAAEAGIPQAVRRLAMMYWYGDNVERDMAKAAEWMSRLIGVYEELEGKTSMDVRTPLTGAYALAGVMCSELAGQEQRTREYTDKALQLFERLGEQRGLPEAKAGVELYRQAGNEYRDREDWERAETCYQKALNLAEEWGEEEKEAYICYELGYLAFFRGQAERAWEYGERSLKWYDGMLQKGDRSSGILRGIANGLSLLADLCRERGDPKGAEERLKEGLELREEAFGREKENRELRSELVSDYSKLAATLLGTDGTIVEEMVRYVLTLEAAGPAPHAVEESRKCLERAGELNEPLLREEHPGKRAQEDQADISYCLGICETLAFAFLCRLAEMAGPGAALAGEGASKRAKDRLEAALRSYRSLGGERPKRKCIEICKALCLVCSMEEIAGIGEEDPARTKSYYTGKGLELCKSLRGPERRTAEQDFADFLKENRLR